MNNSRFVASYYFPATDDVNLPSAAPAASIGNMPVAYQAAVVQQHEEIQLSQQEAYLMARQPTPTAVEAAPAVEVAPPAYEAAPEPYVEPVYSSYAADDSSIPLYYRMASYSAPLSQASAQLTPPTAPPTSINMDAPLETNQQQMAEVQLTVSKPAENAVPLDYFMQNTQLQKEVIQAPKVDVASAQSEARVSVSAAKGFQRMQYANGEDASAYVFETMEDKMFTDNYNSLDNVPTVDWNAPRTGPSEAVSAAPAGSIHQAAPIAPASYPQSGFNQRFWNNGGYNNEESSYLSFQNDVTPAYGQNARYNYGLPPSYTVTAPAAVTVTQEPTDQAQEPAKASLSVSTASVEKSRYNAAFQDIEESPEQEAVQEQQIDLRLIGNAFRQPVLNAASEYQSEHLNQLVYMN